MQNAKFGEKKRTRKSKIGIKTCGQGVEKIKKCLILNETKGVVSSGKNLIQLSFQYVVRENKVCSTVGTIKKLKFLQM